jgi:HPr kinase/phosphorylase
MQVEATAVAIDGRGIVLCGPSGSGKSDLALRLIRIGAQLVGDDSIWLSNENGQLLAHPLVDRARRLAVRSIGIVDVEAIAEPAPLSLAIAMLPRPTDDLAPKLSVAGPWLCNFLPQISLFPFEASATAKVMLAVERFGL